MTEDQAHLPTGAGWELMDPASTVPSFDEPGPVQWGGLGPGWEFAEEALALVQADLSRTIEAAPTLGFAWYERPAGERWIFVGKGPDWFFGGNGPLHLRSGAASAAAELAEAVQDAIVDSLLGYRSFWPRCPKDGRPLQARVRGSEARWSCSADGADFGAVGQLVLDA
ncbi:MAG: hypothetical protein AB7I24_14620 [Candidatus Nanopelagicales bacterium]